MYSDQIPYLDEHYRITFPRPREDDEYGIVLVGGNLSPGMLLSAYEQGVFPWYDETQPILWWNPPKRCVLFHGELHISRSMKRFLNNHTYLVTVNRAFDRVIASCRDVKRPEGEGTWITDEVVEGYTRLHELGYAVSYEVWDQDGGLAGGLYGVQMDGYFCGESMFSYQSNTSKLALRHLYRDQLESGKSRLIDFQVTNDHSLRLGAREISRQKYLDLIGHVNRT
jgi:leucyl/phenylalanyl-tRNA--protein transferase